jgi:putative DNA primase/helicase
MTVAQAARQWRQAGVSIIPILNNGTKRPTIRWAEYQARVPELGEVDQWWSNGHDYGLALICGSVSGNLEMTEIEGRAASGDCLVTIEEAMRQVGAAATWSLLTTDGYMEMSPSGGIHFLYRISDHPVPGNEKIAADADRLVLAETRGEGGYVIVAPTGGLCHPSGEAWTMLRGFVGQLPLLTWEQRCALHAGLKLALDVPPVSTALDIPAPPPAAIASTVAPPRVSGAGLSPNDDFEARTDWREILEPHGYRLEGVRNGERYWTRPGKNPRDGASATTGFHEDRDRLYVFSTSTCFEPERSYTKYMAWTILNFAGDKSAATRELVRRGFGTPVIAAELGEVDWPQASYPACDGGNAAYLRDRVKGRFLYLCEEKIYYRFDGRYWCPDLKGHLVREYNAMCDEKRAEAVARNDLAGVKRWTAARNVGKVKAALELLRHEEGMTMLGSEMNAGVCVLNVGNGVLDLRRGELLPHDPALLQTRMFGASYDPNAACPRFEQFIQAALPDEQMRGYVQRALGYSLLGDVDHRAMFLIYGPSGTGKSTLMETMRAIFADYGTTAAPGTFKARSKESGPTNDLHGLRNKRFVTTSETAEGASFDEDLLKRLTGRDSVASRELYQSNQEWVPECVIWMATNHPPKFNSDDDAIWRRAKLIPFTTQFAGEGEVFDMAHRVLVGEANGILNWLLAGLRDFQERGLEEPEAVMASARELRAESDSVVRFLDDQVSDGVLRLESRLRISGRDLYLMYQTWCSRFGERPLRTRRFVHRMESSDRGVACLRDYAGVIYEGVGRAPGASAFGTFVT